MFRRINIMRIFLSTVSIYSFDLLYYYYKIICSIKNIIIILNYFKFSSRLLGNSKTFVCKNVHLCQYLQVFLRVKGKYGTSPTGERV